MIFQLISVIMEDAQLALTKPLKVSLHVLDKISSDTTYLLFLVLKNY